MPARRLLACAVAALLLGACGADAATPSAPSATGDRTPQESGGGQDAGDGSGQGSDGGGSDGSGAGGSDGSGQGSGGAGSGSGTGPVDVTSVRACELLSEQDLQALFGSDAVETLVVEPDTSCMWTEQGGAISGNSGMLVEVDVTSASGTGAGEVFVPDGCAGAPYPTHGEGSRIVRCEPGLTLVVVQQRGYRLELMVRVDSGTVDEARVGDALGAMLARLES